MEEAAVMVAREETRKHLALAVCLGTVQASWLGPVPRDEKYRYGQASWLGRRPAGMRPASRTRLDGEGCGRRREAEMSWIRAELGRAVRFSGAEGPVWLSILGPAQIRVLRVPHSHSRCPLSRTRTAAQAQPQARPALARPLAARQTAVPLRLRRSAARSASRPAPADSRLQSCLLGCLSRPTGGCRLLVPPRRGADPPGCCCSAAASCLLPA